MKTISLLGGMSWESTELNFRLINEGVKARLGGLHSARIALVSVDFQETDIPLFDTISIHAEAAVLQALMGRLKRADTQK